MIRTAICGGTIVRRVRARKMRKSGGQERRLGRDARDRLLRRAYIYTEQNAVHIPSSF